MTEVLIRHAEQEGYQGIISVVDEWRGGRPMAAMLPKLFLAQHSDPEGGSRIRGSARSAHARLRSGALALKGSESMSGSLIVRQASKPDLQDVLRLYAQPDLDNGEVLSLSDAELILDRMTQYPNYRVYVAISDALVVGTFS